MPDEILHYVINGLRNIHKHLNMVEVHGTESINHILGSIIGIEELIDMVQEAKSLISETKEAESDDKPQNHPR